MKKAFVTGVTGQDGSYLAEFLLEKGYTVLGLLKKSSSDNQIHRLSKVINHPNLILKSGDILDFSCLIRLMQEFQPDEIYHLGAQSHVGVSFEQPSYTVQATGLGSLNMLDAMRLACPKARLYQACSSEMFGNNMDADGFQRESTPFAPVSPYACAKVFAFNICQNYRNAYDMFLSCGILFNHESPRRAANFVTAKVAREAARISLGLSDSLVLGNLTAMRDWGHSKDYVKAMWMILQHHEPDNFVCATGVSYSVQHLVDYVFDYLKLDPKKYVKTSKEFFRPEELHILKGDPHKLKTVLNWEPDYTFESMMHEITDSWLEYYKREMRLNQ